MASILIYFIYMAELNKEYQFDLRVSGGPRLQNACLKMQGHCVRLPVLPTAYLFNGCL